MPAPAFAALASRLGPMLASRAGTSAAGGASTAGTGASAMGRGSIMRSAMSMGHGVSATQFSSPEPPAPQVDSSASSYLDTNQSRW